jgi:arylsulfatase A-like enzyme
VRTVDLVPTLAELLGIAEAFDRLDGRSLVASMREGVAPEGFAYSESINDLAAYHETAFARDSLFALNDGRFKLLLRRRDAADAGVALYDLRTDPLERHDLWSEHAATGQTLRAWLNSVPAILEMPAAAELEPSVRRRLQTLGYVK